MIKNQALGGRTNRALILLGLFLGLVSAALVVVYLSKADGGGGNVSAAKTPVVVASQDIPAGTRVTEEMLTLKPIASDAVLPGAFLKTEEVVGQVTQHVSLTVNGRSREEAIDDNLLLLDYLRERRGLTGTKRGCDGGECGACTVHVNGVPTRACSTPVSAVAGLGLTELKRALLGLVTRALAPVAVEGLRLWARSPDSETHRAAESPCVLREL